IIGTNTGAKFNLPHLKAYNDDTQRFALVPTAIDAFPGRALAFSANARAHNLHVVPVEADAREIDPSTFEPIVLIHVDNPLTIAQLLARIEERYVLFLIFIRLTNGRLLTASGAFEPDDVAGPRQSALLLSAFGYDTLAAGSERVFGALGMPEHRAIEPVFRHQFIKRTKKNMTKMLANLPLEEPGLRLSFDGEHAVRTVVRDAREAGFANPAALAYDFFDHPPFAVEKGEDVVIAEVGAEGEIRLHTVRQRATDGVITVGGIAVVDPRGIPPYETERWEFARQQQRQLLDRAAGEAITRRRPVMASD